MKRTETQLLASDPARHIWVSASAGTGKTHVLTDRLLRLMLTGTAPERLLAITFTKAAAAEMQNRLTERLRSWQQLDDEKLDTELMMLGMVPTSATRQRARSLFGTVLDVTGGLKILTVHSFAQSLLASFPLEAGVSPGFNALDERDAALLKRRAFIEAIRDNDACFLEDLAELSVAKGESNIARMLDMMAAHAPGLLAFRSPDGIEPAIRRLLGVEPGVEADALLREALADGGRIVALTRALAADLAAWGTKSGLRAADTASVWLGGRVEERGEQVETLAKLVWTGSGTVQKWSGRTQSSSVLAEAMAGLDDYLGGLLLAVGKIRAGEFAARALRVGHAVTGRYARLKRAVNSVDFDDMIRLAAALLGEPGMPGYVGWKLDNRFDHILVDEAQDTNDLQWQIVRQLVSDYFTPDTHTMKAPDPDARVRTLFVVGDLKQAIYGFQGTDPRIFASERTRIAPFAPEALIPVPLDLSFRSGPAVLEVVNAYLDNGGWRKLGLGDAPGHHIPHRADAGGEVVLWPLLKLDNNEAEGDGGEGDDASGDASSEAADRLMAAKLAERIAGWLQPEGPDRLWLPARGRFTLPGDILVLLRRRSALMGALVAALHEAGVAVAGADRLLLNEPYAVLDLVALVRFATQPEDDLNLASILVSPFIGWTHEEVRSIAQPRASSLWEALGTSRLERDQAARQWLTDVLMLADREGPAVFLDTILSGPLDGRRKLLDRLGAEANDPIDELLQQAHRFELHNPPALAGFLAWIETEGLEVKRDAESGLDVVRLMTVHGSKGLQAPVVILADTGQQLRGADKSYLPVRLEGGYADVPFFFRSSKELPDNIKKLYEERTMLASQEDYRLLYVAMTRAADHLYIGGAVGRRRSGQVGRDGDDCWHTRLRAVFELLPDAESVAGAWGPEHRLRRGNWPPPQLQVSVEAASARHSVTALDLSVAPEPLPATRPLTPSSLPEEPPKSPASAAVARRGTLMHRLFERLPDVPADRRPKVIDDWLHLQGVDDTERQWIAAQVLAVLHDPGFAGLFEGEALTEAPIAGVVEGHLVSGTVDRLVIRADSILVIDYKTGWHVPERPEDIAMPYRRQMALYVQVLQAAFPGFAVQAGLLFTSGPRFHLLESGLLPSVATLT